jgi:hypothetical protein
MRVVVLAVTSNFKIGGLASGVESKSHLCRMSLRGVGSKRQRGEARFQLPAARSE